MKRFSTIFLAIFLFLGCNNTNMHRENSLGKGVSPIIVKDGSFVYTQLNVRSLSSTEIYADISFTNNFEDSILFYKTLLPLNGELMTNIFSIFDIESLEQINYTGTRNGRYLKLAPDDDEGVIIPDLMPSNFINIPPQSSLSYTINLSKFYDFSKADAGKSLSLVYSINLPAVTLDYKQIFEKDTVDNKMKPVYYNLSLPKNRDIDSMRVHFIIY